MAIYGGPDIITDGLVLHLDAANSKSYPVSIYNRGLSIQEIQQNYNALKGRFGL
jgi:hypothetical protein